jgi:hypothetical protein
MVESLVVRSVIFRCIIYRLLQVPIEIRSDVGSARAAGGAGEPAFEIGQPHIVGPLVGADPDPVRALVVGAIDQQAANAGSAHLGEGDFLRALTHLVQWLLNLVQWLLKYPLHQLTSEIVAIEGG